MMSLDRLKWRIPDTQLAGLDTQRRLRFAASVTLYGGALGAALVLVALLPNPRYLDPEQQTFATSTMLASCGSLAAIIVVWPTARWLANRMVEPRGLVVWLTLGLAYGLLLPFVTGAFVPSGRVLVDFARGAIGMGDVPYQLVDAALRAPYSAYVHGLIGINSGLVVGGLLGAGGLIIDRTHWSKVAAVSKYGPLAAGISLGVAALIVAAYGPAGVLGKLH